MAIDGQPLAPWTRSTFTTGGEMSTETQDTDED